MKKLIIGIALVSSTFFYGCKEKTAIAISSSSIQGTWVGKEYTIDVVTATPQIVQAGNEYTKATTYTFNSDGTFIEKVANFESSGNWIYGADSLLTLKYAIKQGPQDRTENKYKVITQNDSLLVLEFRLQQYGVEHYTFTKKN